MREVEPLRPSTQEIAMSLPPNAKKKLPPRSFLLECFAYDQDTGELLWKKRPRRHFATEFGWKAFNTQFADKPALTSLSDSGNRTGCINGRQVSAKRVVWKIVHGTDPWKIRAINGDPSDLRIENMTECRRGGKSGVQGVFKSGKCWRAKIFVDGSYKWLGGFDSKSKAIAARKAAEEKYWATPQ